MSPKDEILDFVNGYIEQIEYAHKSIPEFTCPTIDSAIDSLENIKTAVKHIRNMIRNTNEDERSEIIHLIETNMDDIEWNCNDIEYDIEHVREANGDLRKAVEDCAEQSSLLKIHLPSELNEIFPE